MSTPASILVTIPLRLESVANKREHWAVTRKRTTMHRAVTGMALASKRAHLSDPAFASYVITVTRVAPRKLDRDNSVAAMKGVVDGIADAIGIDDGDDRLDWRYAQRRGRPKEYAVDIEIVMRAADVFEQAAPRAPLIVTPPTLLSEMSRNPRARRSR